MTTKFAQVVMAQQDHMRRLIRIGDSIEEGLERVSVSETTLRVWAKNHLYCDRGYKAITETGISYLISGTLRSR